MGNGRVIMRLLTVALLALSAGCKIVAIADDAETQGAFSATDFANEIWTARALPHFSSGAKPMNEVVAAVQSDLTTAGATLGYRPADEGSPWTFIVKGEGTVTSKNTQSRAGTLTVTLDGAAQAVEFNIQIGPVVRGNAIRDSLPFVSFKDFTNQLQFADVGKALTALALEGVAADLATIEPGQRIVFTGTMSLNSKSDKLVVTPVSVKPAT